MVNMTLETHPPVHLRQAFRVSRRRDRLPTIRHELVSTNSRGQNAGLAYDSSGSRVCVLGIRCRSAYGVGVEALWYPGAGKGFTFISISDLDITDATESRERDLRNSSFIKASHFSIPKGDLLSDMRVGLAMVSS